jgi:hypothetical protein
MARAMDTVYIPARMVAGILGSSRGVSSMVSATTISGVDLNLYFNVATDFARAVISNYQVKCDMKLSSYISNYLFLDIYLSSNVHLLKSN